MLVTLGTNTAVSAGASLTLPYACNSVSKIFIKVDDPTGTTAYLHNVKVQLGQRVVCQGSGWGFLGVSAMTQSNTDTGTSIQYAIDLGCHELLNNENLYVTLTAGASALDAVDISALVNEPDAVYPIRYTEYSDGTFTNDGNIFAMAWDGDQDIDENSTNVEIRNRVNSSAPSLISANNWYQTVSVGALQSKFGILRKCSIPLSTSFNYAAGATNRILCASLMGTSKDAVDQSARDRRMAKRSAQVSI